MPMRSPGFHAGCVPTGIEKGRGTHIYRWRHVSGVVLVVLTGCAGSLTAVIDTPTAGSASTAPTQTSPAGITDETLISTVISLTLPAMAPAKGPTPTTTAPATGTRVLLTATQSAPVPFDQLGSSVSQRGIGDLQLDVPIRNLDCSGTYVVLLASAIDPAAYRADVQNLSDRYPGSSYLLTAASCSAFEQSVNGHQIYGVYFGPFGSANEACGERTRWPDVGYVKVLRNIGPVAALVEC